MPRDKEISYYVFNEAQRKAKGPLPLAVLIEMAEVQAINPETLVAIPGSSRWLRDYFTLLVAGTVLAILLVALTGFSQISLVFLLSFSVFFTFGLSWVMFFVVTKY